ncbi:hypothetical protein CRE_15742 [Caenorhabditis remanei]|uniref:Integrase catalytic domain-containing protein n=1 Tax=Caenorhabditis remanei TaxID=31234 RepID=E3NHD8_CAERE|nr:hypothetical protein CRE_15742 [Caenorhabditis remanei]
MRELLKLNYLLNALEGEPREHIESFELTDANYRPALAALKKKYGDKKKAVSDLLSRLKKEAARSESIKDQRRLLDKVTAIANQLLLTDEKIDNTLTQELIIEKFTFQIQKDVYGCKLDRPEEWTIRQLLKDLDNIITRDEELLELLSKRSQDKSGKDGKDKKPNARNEKSSADNNRFQEKKARKCLICNRENHYMSQCRTMPNPSDRTKFLEKEDRCGQCLSKGHKTSNCPGRICNKCNKPGHHFGNCPNNDSTSHQKKTEKKDKQKPTQGRTMAASINAECNHESQDSNEEDTKDKKTAAATTRPSGDNTTSIPTIQAEAYNPHSSKWERISLMIDTGADLTFISEKIANTWKLPIIKKDKFSLTTFKSGEPKPGEYALTKVKCRVPNSNKELEITPYISDQLVGRIKKRTLPPEDMIYILKNDIRMNKDAFETSVVPDMIIGNDFVTLILTGNMVRLPSGMALLDTVFGNTTIGRPRDSQIELNPSEHYMFTAIGNTAIDEAQRVEEQQKRDTTMKKPEEFTGSLVNEKAEMERATVEHFKRTVEKRDKSYYVRLHMKEDREELPDNYSIAEKRLISVGRQYSKEVLKTIDTVFQDQLEKGILEIVDAHERTGKRLVHYNPHQPVFTPTKTTTKCRVVVDGSAHFKNKPSLNDQIHQGPTILPDLMGMLLRFRSGKTAVTSDVEKAFLQVYLHEDDRDATRLLWVKDINKDFTGDNIMVLRFTRVLFGLNVSPFLLAATINHHLETINDQDMAREMSNNLYVDNLLMTTDKDPGNIIKLYSGPKETFNEMGMNLREFTTNSKELREMIPEKDASEETTPKVLGIPWDIKEDQLIMEVKLDNCKSNSRRTVSSVIHGIFDPLGSLAALVLPMKLFQRELWMDEYDWDTPLNKEHEIQWQQLVEDIQGFSKRIPRHVISKSLNNKLVTFTDASKEATAWTIYVVNEMGCHLIYAKSKVKPLKEIWTIPKLEMQALEMGTVNTLKTIEFLKLGNINVNEINIFTDSTIALSWVKGATDKKVVGILVANRLKSIYNTVDQITDMGILVRFGHVASEENPADLGTRGCNRELADNKLWFNGPIPIGQTLEQWVQERDTFHLNTEVHHAYGMITTGQDQIAIFNCDVTNNYTKMIHIVAYAMKFLKRRLATGKDKLGKKIPEWMEFEFTDSPTISTEEFKKAREILIKDQQKLITPQQLKKWNDLGVTKDDRGVMVCVGRMKNAELEQETKFPILLQPNSALAKMIILHEHGKLHLSENHTITAIRKQYCLPKIRQQVKKHLAKCVPCQRVSKLPYKYPDMAPLPAMRVTKTRPFGNIGIDGFGPIDYKGPDGTTQKAYGIIYVCMVTRATHIEVVTDQRASSFLQSLRRFIGIRGMPTKILTDNGKNFTLGSKIVKDAIDSSDLTEEVRNFLRIRDIEWKFITPLSPWKGGMYERMVKIAKQSFMKERRLQKLNLEELQTVFHEVAAMMNDRPLTYPDNEIGTQNPIRPSDFMTPRLPVTLPLESTLTSLDDYMPSKEAQAVETRKGTIKMLEASINASEKIWRRFSNEYLTELRTHHKSRMDKKRGSASQPRVGQCVLLWEEQPTPRNVWKIGQIKELVKTPDGSIREAIVKTVTGNELRKSINHLIPLELDEPDAEETPDTEETSQMPEDVSTPTVTEDDQERRYNLRKRKAMNYAEDVDHEVCFSKSSPMTFSSVLPITLIMLMGLVGSAFGKDVRGNNPVATTTPYCSNHGIHITGRFETFEACVEDYCTNYHRIKWNNNNEYDVWIPQDKKIRPHHATIKIFDGKTIKTWQLECQAVQFCDTIDCTICWTNVLNPECHIWWAILGLAATAFIGLLIIHSVCFTPIKLVATFILGWRLTRFIWLCTSALIMAIWMRCKCNWTGTNRRRYNRMRTIVLLFAVVMTPLTQGCQQIDVYTQFQKVCSQENEGQCEVFTEVAMDLSSTHREGCTRLEKNGTVLRDIRIRLMDIQQECTKETITYTQEVQTRVWSSKRCPGMGSCTGGKCQDVNRTTHLPELSQANQYIGNTYCTESCGAIGCGCGWFSSGCMFYRIYAFPTSSEEVEVFQCLDYQPTARLQITSSKLNTRDNNALDKEVMVPIGQSITWEDMIITIDSIWTPPTPTLSSWFIKKRGNVATWPQNHVPTITCDKDKRNCNLHERCTCTSAEFEMQCYCDEDEVKAAFDSPQRHLPIREGHWKLEVSNDTVQAVTGTATMKITMKILKKWSTVTMLSEDRCKATAKEAAGCYACEAGSTAEVNCYTRKEDTMANVDCGKEVFAIRCTPKGYNTNLTFFSSNAKLRRSCSISCGGNSERFEINGNLKYSGSIWTSIYRAIRGDSTLYNEINFPDIEHVIDSYLGYMKTVITVLVIVGIGFLLTYTMITRAGFKVVKTILKGILFIIMMPIEIISNTLTIMNRTRREEQYPEDRPPHWELERIANELQRAKDAMNRRERRAADASRQIGQIIHSHTLNNQDKIHQIVGLNAEITGEFIKTLQAIEEFERQRAALGRLEDLGIADDLEIRGYLANRGLSLSEVTTDIARARTFFTAISAEATTGLRDIHNDMAAQQVELVDLLKIIKGDLDEARSAIKKHTDVIEELKSSIEATTNDIEAIRYYGRGGSSGVEQAPESPGHAQHRRDGSPGQAQHRREGSPGQAQHRREGSPGQPERRREGSPGQYADRRDNRSSQEQKDKRRSPERQDDHRERDEDEDSHRSRSPPPKRRDDGFDPSRPKRWIYPRDYELKAIKNDCAFCGLNHYSDNCQNFESADDRRDSIRGIRCSRCIKPLAHGFCKCRPTHCRYCKRVTEHHYSLCDYPVHIHRTPEDYVPANPTRPHCHAPRGHRGRPDYDDQWSTNGHRGDNHAPRGNRRGRSSSHDSEDPNVPGPSHGRRRDSHAPRRDKSSERGGHRREQSRDNRKDERRH